MKRILLILFIAVPLLASAQRMEVYVYNSFSYLSLHSYGLPRQVVKTNDEMKSTQFNGDGTGIVKRHHTTKGVDERIGEDGYDANSKLSFAFIISPNNVDIDGDETTDTGDTMSWAEASGWDTSINAGTGEYYDTQSGVGVGDSIMASTPTGCAAYRGPNDGDNAGDWRLPTQREMQVMFTVIEQALEYIDDGYVEGMVPSGLYWTSTEFYASGAEGHAWSLSTITGRPQYEPKSTGRMVRCIKDIYETIND